MQQPPKPAWERDGIGRHHKYLVELHFCSLPQPEEDCHASHLPALQGAFGYLDIRGTKPQGNAL
jgi:hypothetical protein